MSRIASSFILTFVIAVGLGLGAEPSGAVATILPPFALNHNAGRDVDPDQRVKIATDRKGTWVAVWEGPANDATIDCSGSPNGKCGPDREILFAISSDAGGNWGDVRFLNTDAESDGFEDNLPQIATDRHGNWVVFWSRDLSGTVSRSTNNGETWSPPQLVSGVNFGGFLGHGDVALETDRQGVWMLAWASNAQGTGGDGDIFAIRSLDAGASWGSVISVNDDALTDLSSDWDTRVALATDGYGHWMITWQSDSQNWGTDLDIFASASSNEGVSWGPRIPVNVDAGLDPSAADDASPTVATDGRGVWVVVWQESGDVTSPVGTDSDILWARSTDLGATWSSPVSVDPNGASDTRADAKAVIKTDGNGIWNTAWMASAPSSDLDLLISTSVSSGAVWGVPQLLNTQALTDRGDDRFPDLAADDAGNWVAVWDSEDDLSGTVAFDFDIFATSLQLPPLAPPNDLAINAQSILPEVLLVTVVGADEDGSTNCGGGTGPVSDIWYRFDLPYPGTLFVDTCGTADFSSVDTVLSLHNDAPGTTANQLACNDDWPIGGAFACPHPYDASVSITTTGAPVWIRVANHPDSPRGEVIFTVGYVPEPSVLAMLGAGLGALVVLRRYRRTGTKSLFS